MRRSIIGIEFESLLVLSLSAGEVPVILRLIVAQNSMGGTLRSRFFLSTRFAGLAQCDDCSPNDVSIAKHLEILVDVLEGNPDERMLDLARLS
jgi:hypothetical protein